MMTMGSDVPSSLSLSLSLRHETHARSTLHPSTSRRADVVLRDSLSGARLVSPSLGTSLGIAGWLSRLSTCALAPDDSAIVGLAVTRHSATNLFLVRLDDVCEDRTSVCEDAFV